MRNYDELIKDLREYAELVDRDMWDCPYMIADNMKQAADAIEDLIFLLTASNEVVANRRPKWISVEERLPEIGQKVLVVGRYKKAVYTGTYNGGQKMKHKKENPYKIITGGNGWRTFTYWMPLPEPPKEEKE